MKHDSAPSFPFNDSHSLYLLGQKKSSLPAFQSYRQLMEKCAKEGEFLFYETASESLSCYARDAQPLHTKFPLLVFRPHSVANIAPFVQVCYQLALPITTRCGGTGVVGGCVPGKEGIVLLTGHLKKIRNYDGKKGTLSIEPGVTVNQLNGYVASDGWYWPLSMATNGVAGIAGCLSCHSRGYHQQQQAIFDAIEQVLLIDGQGQMLEVPAPLVCGAEGLWGVIIEMKAQLKRRPSQCREFFYSGSWQNILTQLPSLYSVHSLTFLTWYDNQFYLGLEGEDWRLPSAAAYLAKHLPGIEEITGPMNLPNRTFCSSRQNFVVISSVFNPQQLPEACSWSVEQAHALHLECLQQADVLAGSLHIILQAKENLYIFNQKIEQFLVLWADFIDRQQGMLASCHGVGMQMRSYMPPFWTEESQHIWRKMQAVFDPKNLFGRERFFPAVGKSLERIKILPL